MVRTDFCDRCRRDCEGGSCYYTSTSFLVSVMVADAGILPAAPEPVQDIHDTYLGEWDVEFSGFEEVTPFDAKIGVKKLRKPKKTRHLV